MLLKVVLLAYSRGIVSSRAIERACRENVLFIAISGDNAPQFTTLAKFIRELGVQITAMRNKSPRKGANRNAKTLPFRKTKRS